MSDRLALRALALAAVLALPVLFAGPAVAAPPAPCNGMHTTDPTGDAEYDTNGFGPQGKKPGTPNMDITGSFFNYGPGADGKPVLTMNTVLVNLDKTVPPPTETGASGGVWYYGYYTFGDETRFVRAANKGDGEIEYKYGHVVPDVGAFITDGDTTGTFSEGPNGVVSIVIPEDVGGKPGDTLGGFLNTVDVIEGEDDFIGINHQVDWTTLKEGEEEQDIGSPNGVDYTVTPCPPASAPPAGDPGGGTPTPPPAGGGQSAPATAPAQAAPAFTYLPFRPGKPALGSAKKAKKKGLSFKAVANADITNLVVKIQKGKKVVATGKAASFKKGLGTFKTKKSKKLKKGRYTLVATGFVDGKKLSVSLPVSVGG